MATTQAKKKAEGRWEFVLRLPTDRWGELVAFADRNGLSKQAAVGRFLAIGMMAQAAYDQGHQLVLRDPKSPDEERILVLPV